MTFFFMKANITRNLKTKHKKINLDDIDLMFQRAR